MKYKEKNLSSSLGFYYLTWKEHLKLTENKIAKNISIFCKARPYFDKRALLCLYYSYIHFYLNYANTAWCSTNRTYLKKTSKSTKARYQKHLSPNQSLLNCTPCAPLRLRALPIINARLRALSALRALRAFVLSGNVLLQLKGKERFVCQLQLTIYLSFLLFYHIKPFACFFSFF